jgi:hypothetical protein
MPAFSGSIKTTKIILDIKLLLTYKACKIISDISIEKSHFKY